VSLIAVPCNKCGEKVLTWPERTAPVWCYTCTRNHLRPTQDNLEVLPSGATASKIDVAWDEIHWPAIRRAAQAMHRGIQTHGKGNWRKGVDTATCLNHLYEHLAQFQAGNTDEDHLAHALCRLMMLMAQDD